MGNRKKTPELVVRDGKAVAVILDIEEYQELLERLEDAEDLAALEKMRQRPMEFVALDQALRDLSSDV